MIRSSVDELRNWIPSGIAVALLAAANVLSAAGAAILPENEIRSAAIQASSASQQTFQPPQQSSPESHARSSVSLAPAVVLVRCKFSQSYTQMMALTNQTEQDFVFEMVAEDVAVQDGKRGFVRAGETPGSIAATAIFTQKQGVVKPGETASVGVTFTVPPETSLRAAVVLFRGLSKYSSRSQVMMTASLGALFTFTVSDNFRIEGSPIAVHAQSPTANLSISQVLTNTGSEPVIASGIAAVLNGTGTLVGKTSFDEQRLLPGERLLFRAEYPSELKTGSYRVLASFEYEENVITSSTDFRVP
jgi:hypothetical protein